MKKTIHVFAIFLCQAALMAAAAFAPAVHAASLPPGGFAMLSGTTAAARPELGGLVLADTLRPFSIDLGGGLSITGTLQDRVQRSTIDGTLDFYFRIMNDAASHGPIILAGRSNFGAWTTDVDWRSDGLGVDGPSFGFRNPGGTEVQFGFFPAFVDPGEDSRFFFIKTDATLFSASGSAYLTGLSLTGGKGASTVLTTYQPMAVPVPAAVWLFGSGVMGLIGIVRRSRRTAP